MLRHRRALRKGPEPLLRRRNYERGKPATADDGWPASRVTGGYKGSYGCGLSKSR